MTTNYELREIMKKDIPIPLEWAMATGQAWTEQDAEAVKKAARYQNRDKIPESYLWMSDLYNEMTGQEPTKRVIMDWMQTFEEWKQEHLEAEHLRAAWVAACDESKGFHVGRPGALTVVAVGLKSKMTKTAVPTINEKAIEDTKKMVDEKFTGVYVPRPANIARPKGI